jgi:hypothetical protein
MEGSGRRIIPANPRVRSAAAGHSSRRCAQSVPKRAGEGELLEAPAVGGTHGPASRSALAREQAPVLARFQLTPTVTLSDNEESDMCWRQLRLLHIEPD